MAEAVGERPLAGESHMRVGPGGPGATMNSHPFWNMKITTKGEHHLTVNEV